MSEDFKFEVGNLVKIDPTAFDEQLPDFSKVEEICDNNLFIIADRKVHWYTIADEQHSTTWYYIPGYDWQGGNGWIDGAWLTRWNGAGQLQMTITLTSKKRTKEEAEAEAEELLEKVRDVIEGMGMPRESIQKIGIRYGNEERIELDMAS
jgi:hypothetical protein